MRLAGGMWPQSFTNASKRRVGHCLSVGKWHWSLIRYYIFLQADSRAIHQAASLPMSQVKRVLANTLSRRVKRTAQDRASAFMNVAIWSYLGLKRSLRKRGRKSLSGQAMGTWWCGILAGTWGGRWPEI